MALESRKNGLMVINIMYLWKFVLKKKGRLHPQYCFWGDAPEEIFDLALQIPNGKIVIIQKERKEYKKDASNVLIRNEKTFANEEEKYNLWAETDGLFCEDPKERLVAGLCGVETVDNYKAFQDIVKNNRVLTPVERITNWESVEKLLTP